MVWNAAHGRGMQSSFIAYPFLGQHFEPALWLLVPLYRLHATPLWLLGAQSLALGAAVVPLWALARRWLGGGGRPAIVCTAYLLQIGVARAAGFDFHTEALAVPFVFVALLGAARGDNATLLLAGVAPMLCKEDGALVTLGIAVLALLGHRHRWRAALVLGAIAFTYATLVVLVVMPHLRAGATGDLVARYAYLGDTPGAIVVHLVTEPGAWLSHLASSPAAPALLLALAAVGFLPLLRPTTLAGCLPALLLPLLAADPYQGALRLHYGLPPAALLVCAAMLGWQRVARRTRPLAPAFLLAGAMATWLALSPLPGGHGPDAVRLDGLTRAHGIDTLLARIPADAPVAASGDLLTHLAERAVISELPALGTAGWIAVDGDAEVSAQSRDAGYARVVNAPSTRGWVRVATAGNVSLWRPAVRPRSPAPQPAAASAACPAR